VVDRRLPVLVARRKAYVSGERPRGAPHVYRGRAGRRAAGLFDGDHADSRPEGRFRWLISTCLGAAVGAVAILVVIYGSSDPKGGADGFIPALRRMSEQVETAPASPTPLRLPGLAWAAPRSDRLVFTSGALSTRFTIQDAVKQRRGDRDYIKLKPYTRIVARLAAVAPENASAIPSFNPFKLYANNQPAADGAAAAEGAPRADVAIRVAELIGGVLPSDDGQQLDAREVREIVDKAEEENAPFDNGGDAAAAAPDAPVVGELGPLPPPATVLPPRTTDIAKSGLDDDDALGDADGGEARKIRVGPGDSLELLLTRAGAEPWQARLMIEAAAALFPERSLAPGQEVSITLVPSLTQPGKMEPVRFGVSANNVTLVTVARNAAGQFVARADPANEAPGDRLSVADSDRAQSSSVYAAVYYASLIQGIPAETILDIMRVHAYETDFRHRVRPGDTAEFFFDTKENAGPGDPPGELLYTSITAGGETKRFYRFRAPGGAVDYYDENGANSKKFLMRKPVRSSEVRLVSGFGLRLHPLLNVRRMHMGVDWAGPIGTPIMAAGNGVIEEANPKGGYGNYVRIRHANGYQTAYGHISRYAPGIKTGTKVRQGQTVAFIGCTGLCQGPHVHYEVLVNSTHVDPLSIQVPNERQLKSRELADFNKERARIDDLMRRAPVTMVAK